MSKRRKIPQGVAAEVMVAVDLRCCMCEPSGGALPPRLRGGQIHHLDEDSKNNSKENLAWLCLAHHEEAGTKGQAARHISAEVVRRYRDVLTNWVRRHRSGLDLRKHGSNDRSAFADALDACVVLDLSKVKFRSGGDWKRIGEGLNEISAYPDSLGAVAREAIMDYLTLVAARTRSRMPPDIAAMIRAVALENAKLYFLGALRRTRPKKSEAFIREIAAEVGRSLVYDGALYLHNLDVVEAGAEILWRTLACAVLTRNTRLKAAALDGFDAGFDGATRGNQPDATTVLTVFRDHGLKGGSSYPPLPRELVLRM